MSDKQKTSGMAFWATVVLVVVLLAYPLSFGPACWMTSRMAGPTRMLPIVYRPILWVMGSCPHMSQIFCDYARFGTQKELNWNWSNWRSGSSSTWVWEARPGP
jgi:hypothetical protein